MHFVVLARHSPEICPTSNAKTKGLLLELAPQIPDIARKHGVNIVAGPFNNREHTLVVILEATAPKAWMTSWLIQGSPSGIRCTSCLRAPCRRA